MCIELNESKEQFRIGFNDMNSLPKVAEGVSFLILHYGDYRLTEMAVKYLAELDGIEKCNIVIVDNGTNSTVKLKNMFRDSILSIIILNLEKNMGFSKGNNYGWRYCRDKLKQDFIVVMNNDVYIDQKDFILRLYKLYDSFKFYVAGPDVVCKKNGIHTNPMDTTIRKISELITTVQDMEADINDYKFYLKEYLLELGWPYRTYKILKRNIDNEKYSCIHRDPLLHGCCLIFSMPFIQLNEKVFIPETFLYGEENYLQYRCLKKKWPSYYFPEIQVIHLDSGSSQISAANFVQFKKNKQKQMKRKIKALKGYIAFIQTKYE